MSFSPCSTPPPEKQPRISPDSSDIGVYTRFTSSVTDHDRYQLIVHHFVPDPSYKFPKHTDGRSFQHQWLVKYPWLKFSEQVNGGYCLPCVLFSRSENFRSDPGVLVKSPLTKFKNALEILNKHLDKSYHKTAVVKMDESVKVMMGQQQSLRVQLNESAVQLIASNRRKLRSIVETILLCGRQNIPLHGHMDSGLGNATACHGNFWALLEFHIAAGDSILRDHLAHAPRNALYTSPDIQNQIIDILGDHIREKVLNRDRQARVFTVIQPTYEINYRTGNIPFSPGACGFERLFHAGFLKTNGSINVKLVLSCCSIPSKQSNTKKETSGRRQIGYSSVLWRGYS